MSDVECPYCGHEYELNHDDGAFYREGEGEEDQCPNCDKYFIVFTSVSYYHEGQKADCLNGAPHNWSQWYDLWRDAEKKPGQVYQRRRCEWCDKEEMEWRKDG